MAKPHALFDFLKKESELKNDAQLARALKMSYPALSKMRSGALNVGPTLILRIHMATEMPVKDILELLKQNQSVKEIYEE